MPSFSTSNLNASSILAQTLIVEKESKSVFCKLIMILPDPFLCLTNFFAGVQAQRSAFIPDKEVPKQRHKSMFFSFN